MILDKLETKINYSGDEFQSEKIVSTASKGLSPVDDISHENVEIRSEITHESGHTVDSQETISDKELYSEFYENDTPKNFDQDELQKPSTGFPGNLELVNTKCCLESCELDVYSSDSNVFSSPAIFDSRSQLKKKQKYLKPPNLFRGLRIQKIF